MYIQMNTRTLFATVGVSTWPIWLLYLTPDTHLNLPPGLFQLIQLLSGRQTIRCFTPTASNAADFTRREVQRSTLARRFQASLGFPPVPALNAGTFINCDILPAHVRRATTIWGPSTAALRGRTTRQRPLPSPQAPPTYRSHIQQHMHCDIMYVNKQAYVVSITQPVGLILVASVDQVSAPPLRQALRRMFGTLGSRHIRVTQFTSDNERGIAALFGAIMVG